MSAAGPPLIMPSNLRDSPLPLTRGDEVSTVDGAVIGKVGSVGSWEFEVLTAAGAIWLARDAVFLSDADGIVVAYGADEVMSNALYRADEVA